MTARSTNRVQPPLFPLFRDSSAACGGRRQILGVLGDYAAAPELPNMLNCLLDGRPDLACEAYLRQLASDAKASQQNRACAGYLFGRWCELVDSRQWLEDHLDDPHIATRPMPPKERTFFEQWLAAVPSPEKIAALKAEAAARLELLSNCPADLKEPAVINVRNEGAIVDYSPELTQRRPAIRDLAAGLLFKMRHLNVGSQAPDLQLDLIDGRRWSLAEHAGKVVVIQFAHRGCFMQMGCAPWVERYPELRWLIEEYRERVAVLSIMADHHRENTARIIELAKLSWSIYWDGVPGTIATKWGVSHVPTDYLVGPDGRIAGRHLPRERLKARVVKLIRGETSG